ncbi:MAG: hypothetical protein K2H46_06695, partial [Muribaculaceae bacterium]|nr:hypothetical protein [Muribaculaceae bacterium]
LRLLTESTPTLIFTYPRASTVAQSLTLTESLRDISERQESARINAFKKIMSQDPTLITPDRDFCEAVCICKIILLSSKFQELIQFLTKNLID